MYDSCFASVMYMSNFVMLFKCLNFVNVKHPSVCSMYYVYLLIDLDTGYSCSSGILHFSYVTNSPLLDVIFAMYASILLHVCLYIYHVYLVPLHI